MIAVCLGIYSGPYPPSEDDMIVSFTHGGVVFPGGQDEADFRVSDYEAGPVSKVITMDLRRKGSKALVWQGCVNNSNLLGKPELLWSTRT